MAMKFYTIWLVLFIIFVFVLQFLIPNFTAFFILNQFSFQQPWRFVTAIFLHGSLIHLVYNIFALVFFGLITEKIIGSRNFLFLFLSSGIFGNVVSVNFYPSSLGASGAIYGIIGTLTIMQPLMTVFAFSIPMPMFLASILWAGGDLLGVFYSPENIGYIAHISGLIIGLVFGLISRFFRKSKNPKEKIYKKEISEDELRNWENSWID